MLYGKPPDINQIKVFGSLCYALTLSNHRTKLLTLEIENLFFLAMQLVSNLDTKLNPNSSQFHDVPSPVPHILHVDQSPLTPSTSISPIPLPSASDIPIYLDVPQTHTTNTPPSPHVSSKVRHPPSHLKDYVCTTFNDPQTQSSSGTPYSISNFISYSNRSPSQYRFSFSLSTSNEPKT